MNIRALQKTQLLRIVAIFFLLHSGVDLLFPELCKEDPFAAASNVSISHAENIQAAVEVAKRSRNEQPAQQESQDEDCFCCCSHVIPSPLFAAADGAELAVSDLVAHTIFIPAAPPANLYHPPRSA